MNILKNALLSVFHKNGIVEFAQFLIERGYCIYASGGTSKHLTEAGVPNIDVATLVGGGAILGHKVVTLSRELMAGLLADFETELEELKKLGLPYIDLVCVDLYPLKDAINVPEPDEKNVISKTDIGGPTMISAGAKGRRIVICDPLDRQKVMDWMKDGTHNPDEFIRALAAKADYVVSGYRLLSAQFHSNGKYTGILGERDKTLRYGENAYQAPAYLIKTDTDDPFAIHKFKILAGNPSMINFTDVDRTICTMSRLVAAIDLFNLSYPYIAIGVKHGNACGASFDIIDKSFALKSMLEGNLKSIFGGTVVVNFDIDENDAKILRTYGTGGMLRPLDVVVANSISEDAMKILERKNERCLIMTNDSLSRMTKDDMDHNVQRRYVRGGWIEQPSSTFVLDFLSEHMVIYKNSEYSNGELLRRNADTILAWAVCSTSNSNTITLVKDAMLIGNGVGQQDRVEAVELAIKRAFDAGHDIKGAVAASDSFFPFPDAPKKLIDAGVVRVFATSGSKNDSSIIRLFEEQKCEFIQIPDKIARGFSNH